MNTFALFVLLALGVVFAIEIPHEPTTSERSNEEVLLFGSEAFSGCYWTECLPILPSDSNMCKNTHKLVKWEFCGAYLKKDFCCRKA
ncbi:hypothetical protein L596_025296 [Steinernema carpocapsae]|uniref:Single domain-containing protein n=1 Tax=Steinernema carpocapsae TaxID=34508 RepID=A0A4U5M7D1_STECR|nr:hypothetical protein L596_025296 [Steinernema carpocapsae]